jgi:hypothetical protein
MTLTFSLYLENTYIGFYRFLTDIFSLIEKVVYINLSPLRTISRCFDHKNHPHSLFGGLTGEDLQERVKRHKYAIENFQKKRQIVLYSIQTLSL